jgi:putative nucleotidyltransferase with HDIG domain
MYVPMLTKGRAIGGMQIQSYTRNRFGPAEAELFSLAANTAAIAVENARLFSETERRLHYVQALHDIDRAITSSLDLRVTLNVLLDQALAQLNVDSAAVLLLNPHLQTLDYAAGRGFRAKAIERSHLRLDEGQASRAVTERQPVFIPDLATFSGDFTRRRLLLGEQFIAYYAVPLIAKGEVKGVLEVHHRSTLLPTAEWRDFLQTLAGQAAIAIDNTALFNSLQRSNTELSLAYDATIEGWSRALDLRDRETEGHTQRVASLTMHLARAIGLTETELVHVRRGALLHDIGKMGIPDGILLKPGPLTDEEWTVMRQHPVYAYELLRPIEFLRPALDIPYSHHEHWDGSGYPRGLRGEQIPLAARVFAVVDVWDALSSDRAYRPAWPAERVRAYLRSKSGQQFDPHVVEVFLELETERGPNEA